MKFGPVVFGPGGGAFLPVVFGWKVDSELAHGEFEDEAALLAGTDEFFFPARLEGVVNGRGHGGIVPLRRGVCRLRYVHDTGSET